MSTAYSQSDENTSTSSDTVIPKNKKRYKVFQNDKVVFSGQYNPESTLSVLRKDLQKKTGEENFFFLDNKDIPILKENEEDFYIGDVCFEGNFLNISTELCSPDGKNLLILTLFALILIMLIIYGVYNPKAFFKVYVSCIVLALALSKYIFNNFSFIFNELGE